MDVLKEEDKNNLITISGEHLLISTSKLPIQIENSYNIN